MTVESSQRQGWADQKARLRQGQMSGAQEEEHARANRREVVDLRAPTACRC